MKTMVSCTCSLTVNICKPILGLVWAERPSEAPPFRPSERLGGRPLGVLGWAPLPPHAKAIDTTFLGEGNVEKGEGTRKGEVRQTYQ